MATDLKRIGEKARKEPGLVFTNLYHHISTQPWLNEKEFLPDNLSHDEKKDEEAKDRKNLDQWQGGKP